MLKSFDVEQQLIDENYLLTQTDGKIDKITNILVDIQSRLINLEKPEGTQ